MSGDFEEALKDFQTWVVGGKTPDAAAQSLAKYTGEAFATRVLEEYSRRTQKFITLKDPTVLPGSTKIESWYCGPNFEGAWCWPGYKGLLLQKGWHEELESLDDASTKILAHLPHPSQPEFGTRGLVLGYVQSGKTANFTGLIAKASDVGYKLIIVLAGMTSTLRRQTQRRLERELRAVSEETQKNWFLLTNDRLDFRGLATGNPNALLNPDHAKMRILCVVKKNSTVLRKLTEFLKNADPAVLRNCPTLIIDDEADQASVNTKRKVRERSAINQRIVDMLTALPKAAYVGYTATPFANLFIDPSLPEDLYPRDFIFDLPLPAKYFGTERIFGRDVLLGEVEPESEMAGLDVIREIPEAEVELVRCAKANQRFAFDPEMVPSIQDAVNYFVLATAARLARGHAAHSSMLVHTTLYVHAHEMLRRMLADYLHELRTRFANSRVSLLGELEALWNTEKDRVVIDGLKPETFSDVVEQLEQTLHRTTVVVDNGRLDGLDYTMQEGDDHLFVIAVGGNTLSRGLTLEGLIVSYFIRPANAYDTLLQMGRWFGYRLGYEDLPRVWMTESLQQDFYHLATVEEEIRSDIKRYAREGVNPLEFGVRVRTHPRLSITSKLKMQNVRLTSASYSEKHLQTFMFQHDDFDWLQKNIEVTQRLLSGRRSSKDEPNKVLFKDINVEDILKFLEDYNVVEDHSDFRYDLLKGYISKENAAGGLLSWNVGVFSGDLSRVDLGFGEVGCVNRSRFKQTQPANIKALTSPTHRIFDLETVPPTSKREVVLGYRQLELPNTGLLMIYPIDKDSRPQTDSENRYSLQAANHIVGLGMMFPKSKLDQRDYVMNDFAFLNTGEGLLEVLEAEEDEATLIPETDADEIEG